VAQNGVAHVVGPLLTLPGLLLDVAGDLMQDFVLHEVGTRGPEAVFG